MSASLSVDDLLGQHSSTIGALRKSVAPLLTDPSQDDIYLLRYLLSHGFDTKKCAAEISRAVEWREKHSELLQRARSGQPLEYDDVLRKYAVSGVHRTTTNGGPLTIVRAGLSNAVAIMDALTYDQVLDWFMYENEKIHLFCDAATRKSRKFVKAVSIIDLKNYPLFGGKDKQFQKATGEATKLSAFLYPQLLQCTVMINVPAVFRYAFPLVKRFFSKKTLDKLKVCPADTLDRTKNAKACPFATKLVDFDDIPTFLGGECNEGIGGVPNEQTRPNQVVDDDGMARITVAKRGKYEAFEEVAQGASKANWTVVVDANRGIEMSAVLKVPDENEEDGAKTLTLMPAEKLKSDGEISGTIDLEQSPAGLLVVTFDNSYTILNSKTLRYKIEVV